MLAAAGRLAGLARPALAHRPPPGRRAWAAAAAAAGGGAGGGAGAAAPRAAATPFPPPPPLPAAAAGAAAAGGGWTDQLWAAPPDPARRVYCNRSLDLASISAVGFDMDHTLAQYVPEAFEALAYEATVEKLVADFGYPPALRRLRFDWRRMARGLVVDKARGNVLKVDRHRYVKLAFHGFAPLPRAERLATYAGAGGRLDFDGPDFALIDTLFSLAESHLFCQLVEAADAGGAAAPPRGRSYADVYRDVRGAVDAAHRDGSIKRRVAADPAAYVHADPGLAPLLAQLRAGGKRLFLATNSLFEYTSVVMNFLLGGKVGARRDDAWLSAFDVVMTGCAKPRFFSEHAALFEVDTATGMLSNTEAGAPTVPISEADEPFPTASSSAPAGAAAVAGGRARARVFQGGAFTDLHKMLGVRSGAEVLYVGDHIYGDVLRSKKALGWRTALVIPELEHELEVGARQAGAAAELAALRAQRAALDNQIERLAWRLGAGAAREAGARGEDQGEGLSSDDASPSGALLPPPSDADDDDAEARAAAAAVLDELRQQRASVRARHRAALAAYHAAHHEVWGSLWKTGWHNSYFAEQTERYACVYTSHVSNFLLLPPTAALRGRADLLAHELEAAAAAPPPRGDGRPEVLPRGG